VVVICPFVYRSSIIFSFPSSFGDVAVVVVVAFFGETNIRVKSRYTNQQQKKEESK